MKRSTILILYSVIISFSAFGQSSLNDLNVIFKHDFENNTLGTYRADEWRADWLSPEWQTRLSETDIVRNSNDSDNPSKALQINFPANSLGPNEGGAQWFTNITKSSEMYVSYDLYFMPGFQFQMGGKLPSVQGGNVDSGKPDGYDGFTGGLMFKEDGKIAFYIYYPDSESDEYGDSFTWGASYSSETPFLPSSVVYEFSTGTSARCTAGTWHNITYRIVLNSIKAGGGGNYDGILEAYFDGKLITQLSHVLFRHTADLGIDCMRMYSFFGGNTDDWRNPIEEWLRIDNVLLYTYKSGIEVPRGNTLSPTNRTLNYWRLFSTLPTNPPTAPTSLTAGTRTKSSIGLKWTDNAANEQGFRIFRAASSTGSYTQVGTVTANITAFTDNSLPPNTTYYYRVMAFNAAGTSGYSNVLTATTLPLQIPASPTSFITTALTKSSVSLKWTDNSNNEQGFSLYRSLSSSSGFVQIATISPNTSAYIDNTLAPATTYYYRLLAYNQDGNSAFTPVLNATTVALQIPAIPTGLNTSHIDYNEATLLWKDNATNESSFELERSGPNNSELKVSLTVPANAVSYTDKTLAMNSTYQYRIRARNADGLSNWSNSVQVVTPRMLPPAAPTKLKSTKFTDQSISVSWTDNSINEEAFVITRSLAVDPTSAVDIAIEANDTAFTDSSLTSSTTYQYTIKAVNRGGSSVQSNKNIATTLSHAELNRIKDGLIVYYNFGYNPDYIVYDQSGYGDPVNLQILNRSAIRWNEDNTIDILSNTAMVSMIPATKIVNAVKQTNEMTFECWLKPFEPDFSMNARIVSLSKNDEDLGFVLDQQLAGDPLSQELTYNIRMQTASTVTSGYPEFSPDVSQPYINLQHLVYTRDKLGKEIVYLNGAKSSDGFRPSDLNTWKNNYYLRLGNESDMSHPWKGSYYSVAIYNKALTLDEVMVNYGTGPCDSIQIADVSYKLSVFPNPATDQVTITITPEHISDYVPLTTIGIWDIYGKMHYQESLFNPNDQYVKPIDLSPLPAGMYFIQVVSGNRRKSVKVILQK